MTHCGDKWEKMFESEPEACEMCEDYRRKVDKHLATLKEIRARKIEVTVKKFPEGAHRKLPAKDDPLYPRALDYVCHCLERGEKVTAGNLDATIKGWISKECSSCSIGKKSDNVVSGVKNQTNVLSPSPDHDVKPEQPAGPPATTNQELKSTNLVDAPATAAPLRPPCLDGKPCPDPNGANFLKVKGDPRGKVCEQWNLAIKDIEDKGCYLEIQKRRRESACGFTPASRLDAAVPLRELGPIKIKKTPLTKEELESVAETLIERSGYFTDKEVGQIRELVKVRYESIRTPSDLLLKAVSWFISQAEGE